MLLKLVSGFAFLSELKPGLNRLQAVFPSLVEKASQEVGCDESKEKVLRIADSMPIMMDVSSPQFFAALAGYFVAWWKDVPFVLEIRDLWPESIVAVGAMHRNFIIRFLERIE